MDKVQALHQFWSGFGIPAIDEQSAYDTPTMEQLGISYPYIAYEASVSELDEPIALGADVYYQSTSWAGAEGKAQEITAAIGYGGTRTPYEGGMLWITRGTPAYKRMGAENVFDIRRIHININAEFQSV